ncbi:MAG: glycoside hydrolase family 5 protein [Fibromonadaceae bacterium]|jgi:endoglucanase|nr:glycoside hydrolase family 5 protein [Fibromonadaceae bacterium]
MLRIILILLFPIFSFSGVVSQNGRLFADGNKIVGEKSNGKPVQLKGPSMQWSVTGWGSDKFFRTETVNALVEGWNAQVIRVPLGLSVPGEFKTGYDHKPAENWERVKTVTDAAIAKDVYVIVDWHSHYGHLQTNLAIDFFTNPKLAGKYGNNPHVIFEIYNEPPDSVSWEQVKTYSNAVIAAIRKAGFKNLILVGNPHWATDIDIAAKDPPADPLKNFALVFHFYADAHRTDSNHYNKKPAITFRNVVQTALAQNIPVFVSEWGTNDATQYGKSNFAETDKWHAYLDSNKISSCAWGATAGTIYGENVLDYWSAWGNPLHYDMSKIANWTDPYRMTPHGRYIYKWLTGKDTTHAPETSSPGYTGTYSPLTPKDTGSWFVIADGGGVSKISNIKIKEDAAYFTFTLGKGSYEWDPYVAASFNVNGLGKCGYGISYLYKGAAHTLRAEQSDVKDWDFHVNYKKTFDTGNWTLVVVPWGFMWQSGWGGPEIARDSSKVTALTWNVSKAATNETGEIYIKDIKCLENGGVGIAPIRSRQPALQKPPAP